MLIEHISQAFALFLSFENLIVVFIGVLIHMIEFEVVNVPSPALEEDAGS